MNPFTAQEAYDRLAKVEEELEWTQFALAKLLPDLVGTAKSQAEETLAASEKTYLLRLLAEFEFSLVRLAPFLRVPIHPGPRPSLGMLLDQIGASAGIEARLRTEVNDKIRDHRNELSHGRSRFPG